MIGVDILLPVLLTATAKCSDFNAAIVFHPTFVLSFSPRFFCLTFTCLLLTKDAKTSTACLLSSFADFCHLFGNSTDLTTISWTVN